MFPAAWAGRKYSIKTGAALRAFIRVAPDVMARARELRRDAYEIHAIREAVKPWGDGCRDRRFETEGEWKKKLAGGTRGTVGDADPRAPGRTALALGGGLCPPSDGRRTPIRRAPPAFPQTKDCGGKAAARSG